MTKDDVAEYLNQSRNKLQHRLSAAESSAVTVSDEMFAEIAKDVLPGTVYSDQTALRWQRLLVMLAVNGNGASAQPTGAATRNAGYSGAQLSRLLATAGQPAFVENTTQLARRCREAQVVCDYVEHCDDYARFG